MSEYKEKLTVIVEQGPNSFQSCMGCVGSVLLGLVALYGLGSLIRSDEKEDAQVPAPVAAETTSAAEAVRPALATSEYDPILALRGLDPQWTEPPFDVSTHYTPSLGLERTWSMWRNTNINYDRTDEGGVYMIQVRSGLPGRCDSGPDLVLAFNQFAEDFALGNEAEEMRPKLIKAWASEDGWAEGDVGKAMVRAIGGCPRGLVIKAL